MLNRYTVLLLTLLCSNKWWKECVMLCKGLFSLLCKLFPFQCIVTQWNAFCFLGVKISLECMPNKPLQYVIVEHVISICYPVTKMKWKQRHQFEQPLWPCGLVPWVFFNLARTQLTQLSKCNVLKNSNGYYEWVFVCVSESWLWALLFSVHPNGSWSLLDTVSQKLGPQSN